MRIVVAVAAAALCFGATAAKAQNWTGFYIGAHNGDGWSQTTWDTDAVGGDPLGTGGFPATGWTMGLFSGAQVGYTAQFGRVVVGAEAAFSGTNVEGQVNCGDGNIYGYICATRLNWLATLTGRVGVALNNTQLYVTGGLAWARHSLEIQEPYGVLVWGIPSQIWGTGTDTARGYVLGVGLERYLSHGMSIRADYSYVRLGARDVLLTSPIYPSTTVSIAQGYHFASIGFNYRFGLGGDAPMTADDGEGGMWDVAAGTRNWLNFGSYRFNLYDMGAPTSQVSRLTYSGWIGWAGEAFVTAERAGGMYLNAMFGTGASGRGTLVDEDFPPYIVPYTATESDLRNGRLAYGTVDVGYEFIERARGYLGVFIGATMMVERYQAFGCTQTASNPAVCVPSVPGSFATITQTSAWVALRFGLMGEFALAERLALRGEAAILPVAYQMGVDNHWLRADFHPLIDMGGGFGFQLETALTFDVTDALNLGLGGRYWQTTATGGVKYPWGALAPQTTITRHFGAFLEATYQLGN